MPLIVKVFVFVSKFHAANIDFNMAVQGNWVGDELILNIRPIGRKQRR